MPELTGREFYGEAYFEGRSRESPPHARALIYPMAARTAAYLCRGRRPRRVVDLGCAKGYLAEALQDQGAGSVSGVDLSRYALSQSEPATKGRLVQADLQTGLPIASGACDLVTALDLFEHLADPTPVLLEIRRILAAGGRAYLKICHPRHPNARRDPSHVNVQPFGYWTARFEACGFGWTRVYEADLTPRAGWLDRLKTPVRRFREWAVIGTPADYKFMLRKGGGRGARKPAFLEQGTA